MFDPIPAFAARVRNGAGPVHRVLAIGPIPGAHDASLWGLVQGDDHAASGFARALGERAARPVDGAERDAGSRLAVLLRDVWEDGHYAPAFALCLRVGTEIAAAELGGCGIWRLRHGRVARLGVDTGDDEGQIRLSASDVSESDVWLAAPLADVDTLPNDTLRDALLCLPEDDAAAICDELSARARPDLASACVVARACPPPPSVRIDRNTLLARLAEPGASPRETGARNSTAFEPPANQSITPHSGVAAGALATSETVELAAISGPIPSNHSGDRSPGRSATGTMALVPPPTDKTDAPRAATGTMAFVPPPTDKIDAPRAATGTMAFVPPPTDKIDTPRAATGTMALVPPPTDKIDAPRAATGTMAFVPPRTADVDRLEAEPAAPAAPTPAPPTAAPPLADVAPRSATGTMAFVPPRSAAPALNLPANGRAAPAPPVATQHNRPGLGGPARVAADGVTRTQMLTPPPDPRAGARAQADAAPVPATAPKPAQEAPRGVPPVASTDPMARAAGAATQLLTHIQEEARRQTPSPESSPNDSAPGLKHRRPPAPAVMELSTDQRRKLELGRTPPEPARGLASHDPTAPTAALTDEQLRRARSKADRAQRPRRDSNEHFTLGDGDAAHGGDFEDDAPRRPAASISALTLAVLGLAIVGLAVAIWYTMRG